MQIPSENSGSKQEKTIRVFTINKKKVKALAWKVDAEVDGTAETLEVFSSIGEDAPEQDCAVRYERKNGQVFRFLSNKASVFSQNPVRKSLKVRCRVNAFW